MKCKFVTMLATVLWAGSAQADWTITIANNTPGVIDAPIFQYKLVPPFYEIPNAIYGNTPAGLPAGTQTDYGAPLAGYHVGFMIGSRAGSTFKTLNSSSTLKSF